MKLVKWITLYTLYSLYIHLTRVIRLTFLVNFHVNKKTKKNMNNKKLDFSCY